MKTKNNQTMKTMQISISCSLVHPYVWRIPLDWHNGFMLNSQYLLCQSAMFEAVDIYVCIMKSGEFTLQLLFLHICGIWTSSSLCMQISQHLMVLSHQQPQCSLQSYNCFVRTFWLPQFNMIFQWQDYLYRNGWCDLLKSHVTSNLMYESFWC